MSFFDDALNLGSAVFAPLGITRGVFALGDYEDRALGIIPPDAKPHPVLRNQAPPDLGSDSVVKAQEAAQRDALYGHMGLGGTFVSGPLGDTSGGGGSILG